MARRLGVQALIRPPFMAPTMTEPGLSQVELLHRISRIVSAAQDLETILKELVVLAMNVTNSDACLVYLIETATNEVVLSASQLPHDSEIGNVRLKMGEGITGWVAAHNSVVVLGWFVLVVVCFLCFFLFFVVFFVVF